MPVNGSRRDVQRTQTITDIKEAAWAEVAANGGAGLSLRAVARAVQMAPSALYRYFASRDELLTELIADGFLDLTEHLQNSYDRHKSSRYRFDCVDLYLSVAHAYRQWALDNPVRYGLIFGTPVPGYEGNERTKLASTRSSGVLLQVMRDFTASVSPGTPRRLAPPLRRQLQQWSQQLFPLSMSPPALAAALLCYQSLHGAINLELNGHLPIADADGLCELFDLAMRDSLERLGVTLGVPIVLPPASRHRRAQSM